MRSGRMGGVLNARAFWIFRTPDQCHDFSLNARAFGIFRTCFCVKNVLNARAFRTKSGRCDGVLNILNARAFRTPDPCPDFALNALAFRIFMILFCALHVLNARAFRAKSGYSGHPECVLNVLNALAFETEGGRPERTRTQDIQDG